MNVKLLHETLSQVDSHRSKRQKISSIDESNSLQNGRRSSSRARQEVQRRSPLQTRSKLFKLTTPVARLVDMRARIAQKSPRGAMPTPMTGKERVKGNARNPAAGQSLQDEHLFQSKVYEFSPWSHLIDFAGFPSHPGQLSWWIAQQIMHFQDATGLASATTRRCGAVEDSRLMLESSPSQSPSTNKDGTFGHDLQGRRRDVDTNGLEGPANGGTNGKGRPSPVDFSTTVPALSPTAPV